MEMNNPTQTQQAPSAQKPNASGVSIASLVLGILSFPLMCLAGIPAIILGIIGLTKAGKDPENVGGKGLAIAGIVLGGIGSTVISIVGILALIAIPNFMALRARAFDASATSAGRNARLAEEIYYQNSGGDLGGGYTNKMELLLVMDPNLTEDAMVSWAFGDCNNIGYTFTTWHPKGGGTTNVFTD